MCRLSVCSPDAFPSHAMRCDTPCNTPGLRALPFEILHISWIALIFVYQGHATSRGHGKSFRKSIGRRWHPVHQGCTMISIQCIRTRTSASYVPDVHPPCRVDEARQRRVRLWQGNTSHTGCRFHSQWRHGLSQGRRRYPRCITYFAHTLGIDINRHW